MNNKSVRGSNSASSSKNKSRTATSGTMGSKQLPDLRRLQKLRNVIKREEFSSLNICCTLDKEMMKKLREKFDRQQSKKRLSENLPEPSKKHDEAEKNPQKQCVSNEEELSYRLNNAQISE